MASSFYAQKLKELEEDAQRYEKERESYYQELEHSRNTPVYTEQQINNIQNQYAQLQKEFGKEWDKDSLSKTSLGLKNSIQTLRAQNARRGRFRDNDLDNYLLGLEDYINHVGSITSNFDTAFDYENYQKYGGKSDADLYQAKTDILVKNGGKRNEEYDWLENYLNSDEHKASLSEQDLRQNLKYAQIRQGAAEEQAMKAYEQTGRTGQPWDVNNVDLYTNLLQSAENAQQQAVDYGKMAYDRHVADSYAALRQNKDFWDKSTYNPLITDQTYRLVMDQGTRDRAATANAMGRNPYTGESGFENFDYMTDEHRKMYSYIYRTQGKEEAEKYRKSIQNEVNANKMQAINEASRQLGQNWATGIPASLMSVPANLMSGMGMIDVALQNARNAAHPEDYRPIDYNTESFRAYNTASGIRKGGTERWSKLGTFHVDENKAPVLARFIDGKGMGDVYQLGMSMADSAAIMGISAALGPIGRFGTMLLGGAAGTQGMFDALDRGATDSQALAMGMLNGAFETIFEYVSIENALDKLTFKKAWQQIASQAFAEGSEEFNTTIANTLADIFVMAEKSEYKKNAQKYIEQGATPEQANRKAFGDVCIQLLWDAFGGAVSGALMGETHYALNTAISNREWKNAVNDVDKLQNLVKQTLEADPNNKIATKLQGRQTATGNQIRKMAEQGFKAMSDSDKANVKSAVGSRIEAVTGSANDALADAITKSFTDETLSRKEQRLLRDNEKVSKQILNELNDVNDSKDSAWVKDIETKSVTLGSDIFKTKIDTFQSPAERQLRALGETGDTQEIAEVISKSLAGKNLTEEEQSILDNSDYGQEVLDKMSSAIENENDTYMSAKSLQATTEQTSAAVQERLADLGETDATDLANAIAKTITGEELTEAEQQAFEDSGEIGEKVLKEFQTGESDRYYAEAYLNRRSDAAQKISATSPQTDAFKSLMRMRLESQDEVLFENAMSHAYKLAQQGLEYDEVAQSRYVQNLTEDQIKAAVAEGHNDLSQKATPKGRSLKETGTIRAIGISLQDLEKRFNDTQHNAYKLLSAIAKATGINIVFYESTPDANGKFTAKQGMYKSSDNSTLYIDVNAGLLNVTDLGDAAKYTMMRTFTHEFTHFIETWSAEGYNDLRRVVFSHMDNPETRIEDFMAAHPEVSFDYAAREVVAEALVDILPQSQFMQDLYSNNQSVFSEMGKSLKSFVDKVKAHFSGMSETTEQARAVKTALNDTVKYAEDIVKAFDKAAKSAVEAMSKAEYNGDGNAMTNSAAFKDSEEAVQNQIRPPYTDGTNAFHEFADNLEPEAKKTFDLFYGFYQRSRLTNTTSMTGRHVKGINISSPYVTVQEWNDKLVSDDKWAACARGLAEFLPENVRKEMRMNEDGTLNPSPLEEEFQMKTSLAQRLVDALPLEKIDINYKLGDKTIKLSDGKAVQSVGGEAYRRAVIAETRKLYAEGKLKKVSIGTMSKDRWGSLGFLAANGKTGASGDLTTLCPQMMFNKGCFYCYRRAAMESGVNNKLVAQSVWYTGEILRIKNEDIDALNRNGGLRIQSFGDWMPQFSAQLADILYDAELRGLQIKIITKEPSMIQYISRLKEQGIGKSLYFNLSADYAIERGPEKAVNQGNSSLAQVNWERPFMRDSDGTFWWKRAMTVEEAQKFREKYPWVNVRIVATDTTEFIRGLADPRVDVVTGYHGNIRTWDRIDSATGQHKVQVEALGDAGMPRFAFDRDSASWILEYPGKTETHKALAKAIEENGLQLEYYSKTCCITGRCASCNGKCGALARSFSIKNYTNRDTESRAYWQDAMTKVEEEIDEDTPISEMEAVDGITQYQSRVTPEQDTEYLELAKNPEENKAKLDSMVEQAARAAGYDSPKLYHGTNRFGFTQIDTKFSDDTISFFATDSADTAGTYSKTNAIRNVRNANEESKNYTDKIKNEINGKIADLSKWVSSWIGSEKSDHILKGLKSACQEIINDAIARGGISNDVDTFFDLDEALNASLTWYTFDEEYYNAQYKNNSSLKENERISWEEWFESDKRYELAAKFGNYVTELKHYLLNLGINSGIYQLYANTDNLFEIDAGENYWDEIPDDDNVINKNGEEYTNTREIAEFAYKNGYAGVHITNVIDSGNGAGIEPANVYIFFNPQSQVKSADPVTYDNSGNVIPLSERFNSENEDIRYQERTETITNRDLLVSALDSVTGTEQKKILEGYKKKVSDLNAKSEQLADIRQQIKDLKAEKTPDKAQLTALNNQANILQQQISSADQSLTKIEAMEPIKKLIESERKRIRTAVADRMREKTKQKVSQRAEADRERLSNYRSKMKQKLSDQKQASREKLAEARSEYKSELERRVSEQAEKGRERLEKYREGRNKTEVRQNIRTVVGELQTWMEKPKAKKYIPRDMVDAVVALMETVDTTTPRTLSNGTTPELSVTAQAKLDALLATINAWKNKSDTNKEMFNQDAYDLVAQLREQIGKTPVNDMTLEQLQMTYRAVRAVRKMITDSISLKYEEFNKDMWEHGAIMIQETNEAAPMLKKGNLSDWVNAQLSPDRFFERLAGYKKNSEWAKVGRMFSQGTKKSLEIQRDFFYTFQEFTEKKGFIESLSSYSKKDLVDIGLRDQYGNPIKITRGMMLSVYMHLANTDNIRAIFYGGLEVPVLNKYYNSGGQKAYDDDLRGFVTSGIKAYDDMREQLENAEKLRKQRAELRARRAELNKQGKDTSKLKERIDKLTQQIDAVDDAAERLENQGMNAVSDMQNRIWDLMTPDEKKFILKAHEWYDEKSSDYINAVTMDLLGIEKARIKNYYSIHRDLNFLATGFDNIERDIRVQNWGALKERVPSSQPIYLTDIMFEMDNHVQSLAKYCGYARAERDFNKLYSITVGTNASKDSVKNAVAKAFGGLSSDKRALLRTGQDYIAKFIEDIAGSKTQPNLLGAFRGYVARGSLTLNLKVALGQLASIPTAAAEVGWGSMMRGFAKGFGTQFSKQAKEELARKSVYFWQRYRGEGGMREFSEAKGQRNWLDRKWNKLSKTIFGRVFLNWVQNMDVAATCTMWSMAEDWVEHNTDLRRGTAEFDKAVEDKYDLIIRKTQPNYTVTERSDMLRNQSETVKTLTMFKTQPNQNFNILYEAAARARKYRADRRAGKNGVTDADVRQANIQLANAYTSVLIGAPIMYVGLRFLANAFLHNLKSYRDKDDEITAKSVMKGMAMEYASMQMGMMLIGAQVYDFVKPFIAGGKYYGPSDPALSLVADMLKQAGNLADKAIDPTKNIDPSDWEQTVQKALTMWGIPYRNGKTIFNAVRYWIEDAQNGDLFKFEASAERTNTVQYNRLFKAIDNKEKYDTIYNELYQTLTMSGKTDKEAKSQIKSKLLERVKDMYQDGGLTENDAIAMLTGHAVFDMDKDKAYWKVKEWQYNETKDDDDNDFSKYGAVFEAVRTGQGFDTAKKDMLDHGYTEKKINSEVTSKIKEWYLDGEISEKEAKTMLQKYTNTKDVDGKLEDWNFNKDNGWDYSERKSEYLSGEITRAELIDAMVAQGKTRQEAEEQATLYDWQAEGLDVGSISVVSDYYEFAEPAGISKTVYVDYYKQTKGLSADVDANGEAISGSKKKKVLAVINKLPISAAQKDALYYANDWAASTINEAPWH